MLRLVATLTALYRKEDNKTPNQQMKHYIAYILMMTCATAHGQKQWTLEECVSYAIEHNISIKQRENNVKQQEIALSTSRNSRLPDLTGSAGENLGFGRALTMNNTYENRSTMSTNFSMNTSVPLITGGRLPNEVKRNRLNLQASIADLSKAKEDVSLNVASAYLEAICAKELIGVNSRQVALSKAQRDRMEALVHNGKASEQQLAELKAAVANDELALTQQTNSYTMALLTLSQLLELPTPQDFDIAVPDVDVISDIVLPNPEVVYSEAKTLKPQIQAQTLRIKSAEKDINISRSALFPSLYFSAGIGTSYYKTSGYESMSFGRQMRENFNQYIGISLNVPIFNRLATRNSIRSARLNLHTQQLQLEETQKALYKDIQQAYYNAVGAQKQCESSDIALATSQTAFELMEKKFANGKATVTEYQESKTAMLRAESAAIQARYTFIFRQKILEFYRGCPLQP